jgi:putative membrane protein
MMHNWYAPWDTGASWEAWIMFVLMVVIVVAVVVGVVYLVRALSAGTTSGSVVPNAGESARDILKRRYARGEIDRAEYQEKLKDLEG